MKIRMKKNGVTSGSYESEVTLFFLNFMPVITRSVPASKLPLYNDVSFVSYHILFQPEEFSADLS